MRVLFALVGLIILCASPCYGTHKYLYGIMIDAGSSGSRIYIYQWVHRTSDTLPELSASPLNQTQYSKKVNPGLSKYATNLDGIPGYLQPLIDYVSQYVPAAEISETPIFLKATGGLRALGQADQDAIMARTRVFLHTTAFSFQDSYAQVIAIEKEALFGWMCANYLSGTFGTGKIVGGLDMGGESTEISFIAENPPVTSYLNIQLGENNYTVYSAGYNSRGLDSALLLVNQYVTANADNSSPVNHPCYLVGYTESFYNAITNKTYSLVGASVEGDGTCASVVKAVLLNTSVPCAVSPCAFEGQYQPPLPPVQFYAYSGFTYTYNALFGAPGNASLAQFHSAGQMFCALNYTTAQARNPSDSFIKNYCFTSNYIYYLLRTYGFADDTTSILFTPKVNNFDVSWAFGAMLYESAQIAPYPNPTTTAAPTTTTTAPTTTTTAPTTTTTTTPPTTTTTTTPPTTTTTPPTTAPPRNATTAAPTTPLPPTTAPPRNATTAAPTTARPTASPPPVAPTTTGDNVNSTTKLASVFVCLLVPTLLLLLL